MLQPLRHALVLTLVCTCLPLASGAAEPEVKIGTTISADALAFKDIRYLTRTLDDLPRSKAYVLVFTSTSCPLVNRYLPTLKRLEKEYRDRGVQFVAVNTGADSIRALAAQMVEHEAEFPFVKDIGGRCAATLGVSRTPEVVVLDSARKLRYRGRIDDQYRLGGARAKPTRNDLKEALDAVLAGKEVAVPLTPVDGCIITLPDLPAPKEPVTFAKDVAPIVQKHCAECHRPGTAAPFSLLTYEQVASKANTIAEVVRDERMPPWYGAPQHTEFINRRGLEAKERETILQWVKGGKQKGDERLLPKPPAQEENGWRIGKPDLVLKTPEVELPAEGTVDYQYVALPHVFTDDTWVQGIQILPDNPKVVHHCNMSYVKLGEKWRMANFITGTVPGGEPMALTPGVGFKIPKGALLVLQIHYVTTGKKEKCQLSVGFKYASGTIDQHLRFILLMDRSFAIPPGAPAHPVSASRELDRDAIGVGLFTHMHVRGRDMTFRAHYPDGKSETLLVVPNYSFDWQMAYRWEPGKKKLPKGTRLEAVAHPKATVRDGLQTMQEMMNGFVFYLDANEKLGLQIDGKTGRVKEKVP
jgi:thiol-disulfide isomerase/thioredoxin/mono/diheme cytochrome c family protein